LKVFEKGMMMRLFGPGSEAIVGGCSLFSSQNIIKRIKSRKIGWTRHVAHMEDSTNENIVFVRETEGNTPLERRRCS
jgi:hypothetical protein